MTLGFMRRAACALLFTILLLTSYRTSAVDRLEGRILDDAKGTPVAATLLLSDADGKPLEIDGKHSHVQYLGKRRCYVDGSFTLSSRPGRLKAEVRRGLESFPVVADVYLSQHGSGALTFRLRRWIDMRERGYLSGDAHVHFLSQAESHMQMRAEDLHVLNLLVGDFTNDRGKFTGKLDPVSTADHAVFVGQEFRDWQNGHVILLGIKQLIEPFEPFGGKFQDRTEPNLVTARALREARRQGGLTTWAHFCNLPGAESPIDIALGLVDAIELVSYDDPSRLPSHWGPWTNSGMSQAEFTVMRSMDLYYCYLNSGFQLPIAAGTDKMSDVIPVGSNRLYARFTGEPTYEKWLASVKAGNGFVTNGPMLTFDVHGHTPGDAVTLRGTQRVKARATAKSILPFQSLEIMLNGEVTAIKNVGQNRSAEGLYSVELEAMIDLDRSSWLAARVAEHPGSRNQILPRGLTVFAHTNPVYFLLNGAKVRELASIQYLQKYVNGSIHWLNTAAKFRTPAEKEEALLQAQQARDFYAGLAR